MIDLSVILPVFNEEKNIWRIAKKYSRLTKKINLEIIFIEDGGSKDNTRKELQKITKQYPFARYLFTTQRGYGISIYNGLKAARGTYLCWTHSDLQTDPNDVLSAYILLQQQKDKKHSYIKGDRYGRPFLDQFLTYGMTVFETLYTGTILHDINAQPNMFDRSFLRTLKKTPHDFSFDLFMLYVAKRRGLHIVRFPVHFGKRIFGTSSWNTGLLARYKFIKRTISFSLKLDNELEKIGLRRPGFFRKYGVLISEIMHRN